MKINLFPWRHLIAALFFLALPAVVPAQFNYIINSDGRSITITGYTGPGGAVLIPEWIKNYRVAAIANDAFAGNTNITSVTITNSFVILPISIGTSAFMGCSGLTSIYLGNTVTNIGDYAFADCTNLTSVYFADFYNISGQGSDNIGVDAFTFCTSLTSVYISSTVTNIGDSAFAYCGSLTSVAIQGTNTAIGSLAFAYCTNVAAYFDGNAPPNDASVFYGDPGAVVYYPPGTTGWGTTFDGAPTAQSPTSEFSYGKTLFGLTSIFIAGYNGPSGTVVIPPIIDGYPVTSIENIDPPNVAFPYYVTNVTIPITVTSIGDYAFEESRLTSITIPDSVTSIGQEAFEESRLTRITIPDSVTSIAGLAFDSCGSLTSVIIANGVNSIGAEAFYRCGLTSVTIPASVTAIGYGPFADCTSLTNISVDAASLTYTSLDGVLFDKAQDTLIDYPAGLTNLAYTIPNSVTNIGESAFEFCGSLVNIVIPNSVTNIEFGAFTGCASLTNILIPDNVTSIGNYAFSNCGSLTSVYFEGNAPPDFGRAFYYGRPARVYYLPGTTGWGTTYGGAPTALWLPTVSAFEPSFGVQNHQFSFLVSWAPNTSVIVQACTNQANPNWIPVATNVLSNGTNYFSDPQWTNYPCRFYRVSGQ